ncbi:MAG: hypothetical protein OEO19_16830 [Gammaproteobacteria bacterium]|nr:hypothetical protein [Gammaproteobacteria bacterium]MDH3448945.1 hypothetical protein [Gammaproteobacteria bacterium]
MSDQLFEVAFSGAVSAGANPDEVKARVGKMFNADADKLAQLFSGKRIVIKKNIDLATAAKYRTALNRAGAECEVQPMGGAAAPADDANPAAATTAPAAAAPPQQLQSSYDGEVPPPPQTDPLGITGDQIEDLAVSIAPVGSELKDDYQEPEEPDIDITGFDIAPVGADLGSPKKEPDPPPPDTTGISLAD